MSKPEENTAQNTFAVLQIIISPFIYLNKNMFSVEIYSSFPEQGENI